MLEQFGLCPGKNAKNFCNTNCKQLKSVISMELEQQHIIKLLHLKGLKLQETATELSNAYGQDAYAKPSIKYWPSQIRLGRNDLQTRHVGGREPLDDADTEILALRSKFPFSSVQTIAYSLNMPVSTIHSHLVDKIGLKMFRLRWAPHMSNGEPRRKRVELAVLLLRVPEAQQRVGFLDTVTGDE
jgi:hypothetical protein